MRVSLDLLEDCILPRVDRPNRYLGTFLPATPDPAGARVRVLLVSPRELEDGLPDPGLETLHGTLSGCAALEVDLAFLPGRDLHRELLAHELPVHSLGLRLPVAAFDVVLFWLADVEDLARAAWLLRAMQLSPLDPDRKARPEVLACGPAARPAIAIEDWFDGLLAGPPARVAALLMLPGEASLVSSPAAEARTFLRPLAALSGDRLTVELVRGCMPGCALCLSGLGHTAVRARPNEEVLDEVTRGMAETGWDELRLQASPSAALPGLRSLLDGLERILMGRPTTVSVTGLSGLGMDFRLAESLGRHRRGILTLHPVAVSGRLRRCCGIELTDDDLQAAVESARAAGMGMVRLAVTLGVPGEESSDLEEFLTWVRRAQLASREGSASRGNFQLTVSWDAYEPALALPGLEGRGATTVELSEKVALLEKRLARGSVRGPSGSRIPGLRAALARGGAAVGVAIGQLLDLGWSPHHDQGAASLWTEAASRSGLNFEEYLLRAPQPHAAEPEAHHRFAPAQAPAPASAELQGELHFGRKPRRGERSSWQRGLRFRLEYRKTDPARFTSHLDVMRALERAFRKAGLPLAYSQGNTRHAKISAGPPLALGFTGAAEYIDVEFARSVDESFMEDWNEALPSGLCGVEVASLAGKPDSLTKAIDLATWTVRLTPWLLSVLGRDADSVVARWNQALHHLSRQREPAMWPVKAAPGARLADARALTRGALAERRGDLPEIRFETSLQVGMRPEMFVARLTDIEALDPRLLRIERTGLWITKGTRRLSPLQAVASAQGALAAAMDWA